LTDSYIFCICALSSLENMASSDRMYKELERMWWGAVSGLRLEEVRNVVKYQVGLAGFRYEMYIYRVGINYRRISLRPATRSDSV